MISKTHSKAELIDIINDLQISNIELSHSDTKSDTHTKILAYIDTHSEKYLDNVYRIGDTHDLRVYLANKNPKKNLSVKEKSVVMGVCKEITRYAKSNYIVENTRYASLKELEDDMLFVTQFGDLPSVRRSVKLMNQNIQRSRHWTCVISPQVKKIIEEKEAQKKTNAYHATFRRGEFIITFD